MLFKYVCEIVLIVSVCVVSAHQDVSVTEKDDVGIKLDITNISGDVFRQVTECTSDSDCHHLGKCETREGKKVCKCKTGTSGDFCYTVDECVDNPVKCGTLKDVSCVFDVVQEKAVCKCDNTSKTYVVDEERCMSPCTEDQCGDYGYCYHEIGNLKFCACEVGTMGDYCEIIVECHNKNVDCGIEHDVTCNLTRKGKAVCKCTDTRKKFDDEEKKCKDCNCGADAYSCNFVNGTKICNCYPGYKPNGGVCNECDCGSEGSNCDFKNGVKVCTCKEGYIKAGRNGICTQMCNATSPCANGGKCVQQVCSCLKGTSGPMCKTIDGCDGRNKCGNADCLFNETSLEAYCKCSRSKQAFDDINKMCRDCDCGTYQRSCVYVKGKKKCNCMDAYEDRLGVCALCFCKGYSSMYGCHFDGWNLKCNCLKGNVQQGDECKACDCGDHGNCTLEYSWGQKRCTCEKGYTEIGGKCVDCDCGENARCEIQNRKKVCTCWGGYKEYKGSCKECSCSGNADCQFDEYGYKDCNCPSGQSMKRGVCTECKCEPGTSCIFDRIYTGSKECICPTGYVDDWGYCKDCNCNTKLANCTLIPGSLFTKCICPSGYEEEMLMDLMSRCKKVDQCYVSNKCPRSTKCINMEVGYKCECGDGYEEPKYKGPNYDIMKDGCDDIDECVTEWKPCNDPNTRCVNTPGSYRCDCTEGFSSSNYAYQPKENRCEQTTRPWRTASIVVGCLSALISIGLLIGICNKHMSLDDC